MLPFNISCLFPRMVLSIDCWHSVLQVNLMSDTSPNNPPPPPSTLPLPPWPEWNIKLSLIHHTSSGLSVVWGTQSKAERGTVKRLLNYSLLSVETFWRRNPQRRESRGGAEERKKRQRGGREEAERRHRGGREEAEDPWGSWICFARLQPLEPPDSAINEPHLNEPKWQTEFPPCINRPQKSHRDVVLKEIYHQRWCTPTSLPHPSLIPTSSPPFVLFDVTHSSVNQASVPPFIVFPSSGSFDREFHNVPLFEKGLFLPTENNKTRKLPFLFSCNDVPLIRFESLPVGALRRIFSVLFFSCRPGI